MAGIQDQLKEFERLLNAKQKELLRKQNDILTFVDTAHRAKATKKYQQEVRALAKEINDFVILLIETKENSNGQKELADKLFGAGMGLNGLVKDLGQALANDLSERQHDETVDVVKIAGAVGGLAAAAVTVSKYTFDQSSSHAVVEASIGASFGLAAAMWKPICKGFIWAGQQLCASQRNIKHSFTLYYIRETSKEFARTLIEPVTNEGSLILCIANDDYRKVEKGTAPKRKGRLTEFKP